MCYSTVLLTFSNLALAKKRKYRKLKNLSVFISFFFHAWFLAFTQGILDFFSRKVVGISRIDFSKKFSRKELCSTHTFEKKFTLRIGFHVHFLKKISRKVCNFSRTKKNTAWKHCDSTAGKS